MYQNICVFCGSNYGYDDNYHQIADQLGQYIAKHHQTLIYGGGKEGLMGTVSHSAFKDGADVIGIVPNILANEGLVGSMTQTIQVDTMSERKLKMMQMADAFVVLPGGFGTFEELFQTLSWSQLGIHQKPVGILNIDHFYDPLIKLIYVAITEGFIPMSNLKLFVQDSEVNGLFDKLNHFQPTPNNKPIG